MLIGRPSPTRASSPVLPTGARASAPRRWISSAANCTSPCSDRIRSSP
jgi:hypothetical protein